MAAQVRLVKGGRRPINAVLNLSNARFTYKPAVLLCLVRVGAQSNATLLATTLAFQLQLAQSILGTRHYRKYKMAQAESISSTNPLSDSFPITRPGVRPKPRFDKYLRVHDTNATVAANTF
jgi:hypothetical protein